MDRRPSNRRLVRVRRSLRLGGASGVSVVRRMRARWRGQRAEVSKRGVHLVVCGGRTSEWMARSVDSWDSLVRRMIDVAVDEGVGSITMYPIAGDSVSPSSSWRRQWSERGVTVTAVGDPDGRHRIAETINAWPSGLALTEETLGSALVGPAGDPDVVVVVGPPGRLPSALVWELAYAELVDIDRPWSDFSEHDLRMAMAEYRTRHRRFGGIDENETDG